VAGDDGSVTGFAVQSGTLDKASKQKFPVAVLSLIRRQAEDFLLSNSDDQKGREALQFVLSIAEEISGDVKVDRIKKCKFLNTISPKKTSQGDYVLTLHIICRTLHWIPAKEGLDNLKLLQPL